MTKNKHTKRALLASLLSMFVCIAMLIGSTFAWFTDTATTAVNSIQSGTLDVDLVDEGGASLEGKTLEWKTADNRAQDQILWEPGCTYELQPVYIKNNGDLALKYKIVVNGVVGDAKLLEVIDFTYGGFDISAEGHLKPGETSSPIIITGKMKESAGNDYQDLDIKGIGITVVATQDTVEKDSTDSNYDAGAVYPVANSTGFTEALGKAEAGDKIELASGNYELSSSSTTIPEGVSIVGNGEETTISADGGIKASNDNITISNVSIEAENVGTGSNPNYDGYLRVTGNNVTIDNVTIDTTASKSSASPIVIGDTASDENVINIKNCNITAKSRALFIVDGTRGTINVDKCTLDGIYTINVNTNSTIQLLNVTNSTLRGWTSYGDSVVKSVFDGCTFARSENSGYDYFRAYADTDLINCDFNDDNSQDANGFYFNAAGNKEITINFNNCRYNGTALTNSNFDKIKDAEEFNPNATVNIK